MTVADRLAKTKADVALATPQAKLQRALERHKLQLSRALPAHMNIDRFLSVVNGAVGKNPDIALCEPMSIMQAVGQAARMGLEIDISGHGFLVPYNDNRRGIKVCQFIPGWQGIVDLINRSGRGVVKSGAVFHGDFFDYDLGLDAFLKHRNDGVENPDKLIYTYAIGHIRGDGGWMPPPIIEVWKVEKVQMHLQHYNRVGDKHYALKDGNNWVQYARKLPLLQVCKYMPKSAEVSKAIEASNRADSGEPFTIDGDFDLTPEGGGGSAAGPTVTYAALVERLKKAKTRDDADLIIDEARALPAEQYDELVALANKTFNAKA